VYQHELRLLAGENPNFKFRYKGFAVDFGLIFKVRNQGFVSHFALIFRVRFKLRYDRFVIHFQGSIGRLVGHFCLIFMGHFKVPPFFEFITRFITKDSSFKQIFNVRYEVPCEVG
jgi:hypothetical protein